MILFRIVPLLGVVENAILRALANRPLYMRLFLPIHGASHLIGVPIMLDLQH